MNDPTPRQPVIEDTGTTLIDNGGSYLKQYLNSKNKQHVDYKEYTIDDYRKIQKEEQHRKLGTLGPDMENDDLRERVNILNSCNHL